MTTRTAEEVKALQETALEHLWVYLREPSDMAEKGEPQIFVEGKGVHVTDALGNQFIDAMSGLWLKNVGYGRTEIADAAYQQMLQLTYMPMGTTSEAAVRLSDKIASITPGRPVPLLLHQRRIRVQRDGHEAGPRLLQAGG